MLNATSLFPYLTMRDRAFAVTGGRVTGARRVDNPHHEASGMEPNREWRITVRGATMRATGMIVSLREKIAGLRAQVRALEVEKKALVSRVETLEAQLVKLRASRTVLSKSLFGRKSEQQKKPRSGRKRGQQRGAPGHGRTPRPGLDERTEKRNPPMDARVCSCCGKPYIANGERSTTVVEIEVKAHTRRIVRPRWRRSCDCASSLPEVTAPPVLRLFDNTPYGISVWVCILFERFVCCRPLHRVSAWLADMGLAMSPGTLADSVKRFVPLFEPVAKAILAHQNKAALRHADETTWRVQAYREKGRSSRAWLWTSVSGDAVYFHIDPSRSAEVAKTLFGGAIGIVVLVCDRLSTYKSLARELDGKVILQWCWVHQRRSFIDCAAGHVRPHPLVPGMDRAGRGDLPAEQGAAGALRPRSRTPGAGVRRGAGRTGSGGRAPVRRRRSRAGRPVGQGAQGQAATLAAQPPGGVVRLHRQATGSDG